MMDVGDLERLLVSARRKNLELLEAIQATGDAAAILSWRPGEGRAHLAWQFMHIAATEDRHLNVRMLQAEAAQPELVARFGGGSIPDDDIPTLDQVLEYLHLRREALMAHLRTLPQSALDHKPHDQAQWIYREWFEILAWHEAHHHGQAHLTYNLYRTTHNPALPKVGH